METQYARLIRENLGRFFDKGCAGAEARLGASLEGDTWRLRAFGKDCLVSRDGVTLGGASCEDPRGLIVSLYALHAGEGEKVLRPFRAFKDLPGSMPYQGAFHANTERLLIPHVPALLARDAPLMEAFSGGPLEEAHRADGGFLLQPLPKIALAYLFYLPDEDFPASVTCLFSQNARDFLPLDALADVGEYTSRALMALLGPPTP